MTTPHEFQEYIGAPEGSRFEFKSATTNFHFEKLIEYCVALANEGGGKIILGVTDRRPRQVVGSSAFAEPGRTEAGLFDRLRRRIPIEEYFHEGKRVLIVHVPARIPGTAWSYQGTFWMRAGDDLVGMHDDRLREIHNEVDPDFSAEVCREATIADLDPDALKYFRKRWAAKSQNQRIEQYSDEQTLVDAELSTSQGITNAALVLLAKKESLARLLPHAEVVFEYRSNEAAGPAAERHEFREGFLLYVDRLWDEINKRNDRQSYQDGFFRLDIPTFDEKVIREAILNAVCHRSYRLHSSCFVRQYPQRLEVVNPGGFPFGITSENVLEQQNPRNRRLAEAFAKCGLIERSGQGMNLMFEQNIKQSKPLPDFTGSASHEVRLILRGLVTNPAFIRFLEKLGEERLQSFSTFDFLVLDRLQREESVPESLRSFLGELVALGVVEPVGRGRGTRYILSKALYAHLGKKGVYTRKRGLDHETNKQLLLKHIIDNAASGSPLAELCQVLPSHSPRAVQRILRELYHDGKVILKGTRRWARWYPGPAKPHSNDF